MNHTKQKKSILSRTLSVLCLVGLLAALAGCGNGEASRAEASSISEVSVAATEIAQMSETDSSEEAETSAAETAPASQQSTGSSVEEADGEISLEKAIEIALEDAGVSKDEAAFVKAVYEIDDGVAVYDMEFFVEDMVYDYEILAEDGTVYSKEIEPKPQSAETDAGEQIGEDRAKEIALEHAELTDADVTFTKAELDLDDEQTVYDIEFRYETTEYEYEIHAQTGEIVKYETN